MNDTVITAAKAAQLKSALEEIKRVASERPTSQWGERETTDRERLNQIERLASKAMRNLS